ncbi:hypothetical protein JTE90_003708 [Oedothorax gibbosus]|uniref:Uncharacterized protein n=1 Tax=Oedothorax gibbosus TaxID=931172 RepID=A0AAV6VBR7_9ARAC|nr:hypothetical protein JTE90_003708 [Oedothorax gibbosus]
MATGTPPLRHIPFLGQLRNTQLFTENHTHSMRKRRARNSEQTTPNTAGLTRRTRKENKSSTTAARNVVHTTAQQADF